MPILAAAVVFALNAVLAAVDSSTAIEAANALAATLTAVATILGVRSKRRNGNRPPRKPTDWFRIAAITALIGVAIDLPISGVLYHQQNRANKLQSDFNCWVHVLDQAVAKSPPPPSQTVLTAQARRCAHIKP